MIRLAKAGLEALGLAEVTNGEAVEGSFQRLLIYQIEGFETDEFLCGPFGVEIDGFLVEIAVATEIGRACMALVDDTICDTEEEWCGSRSANGPFLVLLVGPTKFYRSTCTHERHEADAVYVANGFPEARAELDFIQEAVVPRIVSSLSATFNHMTTTFRFIEQLTFGADRAGKRIHDLQFSMALEASVLTHINEGTLSQRLRDSLQQASRLNKKAAGLFDLALAQKDFFKQYLFLFSAAEIVVHATFKINYSKVIAQNGTYALDDKVQGKLRDRFGWLQKHIWIATVSSADVDLFRKLADVRNDIAHGSVVSVNGNDLQALRDLVTRLIAG
ncbi:hypothetical protein [Agrobacterium rosae]|uniref:Apea-like HEPN domain-containing protein n=1 Tax=Agrobacterium rosae TaxID=1972867 RepID=A0A1R3TXR3_9HYPH|nr:hypothetical protein [Agrobacterium rosae]SCX31678.1 hypothetical protein DSM25559_3781 [Agrobacterium rosae]